MNKNKNRKKNYFKNTKNEQKQINIKQKYQYLTKTT